MPLSFNKTMNIIKRKYEHTKSHHSSQVYPAVAINTNIIAYEVLKGINIAKHTELIVAIYSNYSTGVLIFASDAMHRRNSKREAICRRCKRRDLK